MGKRKYVSPLLLQLVPGDDVVEGGGSAQGGIEWASVPCTAWNGDNENWGEISDSAGNLWAYGPFDPDTPGEAWQLVEDMDYWSFEEEDFITVSAGTWVDFDTLVNCLEWTGECEGMGGL